jgi:hypothetical protein
VLRRRLVAVVMSFTIVVAFLTWTLIPLMFGPELPEYHAADITIEETNVLEMYSYFHPLATSHSVSEGFLPERVSREGDVSNWIGMYAGLGRMTVGNKSYTYVFAYFWVRARGISVSILGKGEYESYILAFFCNSSEVCELLGSHRIPCTYVKATYRHTNGSKTYTYIRLDHPDGRPLIEISAIVPVLPQVMTQYGRKHYFYHLNNNNNLTVLDLSMNHKWVEFYSSARAYVNATFTEGSDPWRYMGQVAYTSSWPRRVYSARSYVGKIGWLEWKSREE